MRIHLLAFATAAEAIGNREVDVELPSGSTVEDLGRHLISGHPSLAESWPRLAVAVDGELAQKATELYEGVEVALLPPVSGGAPDARAALVEEPLDIEAIEARVSHPSCGATLVFVGRVRGNHRGRTVGHLEYEAYQPMALAALERIAVSLEEATPGVRMAIVHRLGSVQVGAASVVIATASPHRAAAYEASRTALERLKREVPIWKREHYAGGGASWREEEALARPQEGAGARSEDGISRLEDDVLR